MAKTRIEKIEGITAEIKQLENQKKQLLQQQRAQDRKDRTKRLCIRAGLIESLLPETVNYTDEQFKHLIEKTFLTDYARRTLNAIKSGKSVKTAEKPMQMELQGNDTAAPDTAEAAQGNSVPTPENEGDGAGVEG